jgi:tRNA 2-thiocytidine biosynthesis protein TtcA
MCINAIKIIRRNKIMSTIAGKGCPRIIPEGERKSLIDIERSIIKGYRKHIWTKFVKAVKSYNLIEEGDKIAVGISGGKDSILMAKLFQELQRHGQVNFELVFLAMDPGYHPDIKKLLVENCEYLNIPIHIYESGIFEVVDKMANDYPCYLCARMRRGSLYAKAKEFGCNKLALGHHYNDVIETTMLNILYAGNFKTMLPKLKAKNFENLELIRPMYYIEEEYIRRFIHNSGIWPLNCACMVAAERIGNKRYEIKDLIKELKKNFDGVEKSIFKAAENVSMDSILGWQKGENKYSFLDFYNEE